MSYADTPSARFLFAILKQKSLKDIDWNQVARDPVLAQPITNGHAARMRFSRLRAAIQGPTKRPTPAAGPINDSRFRITKSKKEAGSKQPATNPTASTALQASLPRAAAGQRPLPLVKTEPGTESPMFSPYVDERLLTPCSDDAYPQTPLMPQTPDMAAHPAYFLNPAKTEYAGEYECDDSHGDDRTHISGLFGSMGAYPSNFESAFTAITDSEENCDLSATQDLTRLSATQNLTRLSGSVVAAMLPLYMPAEHGRNYGSLS